MDLLKRIQSVFKGAANPGVFGFFSTNAIPRMSDKEYIYAYKSWVFACTNKIAEAIAGTEMILQKKNAKGEWENYTKDNPAMALLHDVNDHMSYYDLAFNYAAFQELSGNSFWYMPQVAGKPAEIWPLQPTQVAIVKDAKNYIKGYVFTNDKGVDIPLEPNEVLHFKRFNSTDRYRGRGTVEGADLAIDINQYASEWQRNFFGNSATPSAMLTSEKELTTEQYNRLRANWDSKYKGLTNAHKLAIIEGSMKYTSLEPTSREMQYTESKKNIRDEICGMFGVPLPVLGILDTANLASADAVDMLFAKNTVKPKLVQYATKLTEFYLPLFGMLQTDYRIWFADPVPENLEQKRLDRESGIKNYYMTPNEARGQVGLKPLPGGDFLYVPTLYAPIDPSAADDNNDNNGNNNDDSDEGKKQRRLSLIKRLAREAKKKKERKIKINVKQTAAKRNVYIAGQISSSYNTILNLNEKLKSMILENLQTGKGIHAVFRKMGKATTGDTTNQMVQITFSNFDDWIGLLYEATKDHMQTVMEQSGKDAIAEVGLDMTFDMTNTRALDYLNQHALENTESYSDTMKEDIALKIQEGVELGQGADDIAATIGAFFDDQGDYRAERLARTETIDAYAQGNLEGYRQSGVVTGKEWLPDDNACPICEANVDDGVISLEDDFNSGDDAPPAHPNCECALQPITATDE